MLNTIEKKSEGDTDDKYAYDAGYPERQQASINALSVSIAYPDYGQQKEPCAMLTEKYCQRVPPHSKCVWVAMQLESPE
jgi:hypothetical protein